MADPNRTDEAALVARIARQDQSALSELYDRYVRMLAAVAFKILGSIEEAEEVVLDVFCQVWRTAASYDARRSRVDAWLFMLTRSRSLDRLRALQRSARARNASVQEAHVQWPIREADTAEQLDLIAWRGRVNAALERLPDEQRRVLELAYYQGLTHTQIAAQTGKPLGTVKTRIRLGLNKLRDALGNGG
ncbi:MAG: sigma-70 family RNA polymerase sigma factor [Aphanocapsa lilacina HA4352-LM1]|jgi:RNA polymerase sigma-70 factor (ECF subfamily)|nr:sigma-70 family RNA polymerase sigma factor [Aphanocapsa lilacina HA4352-LM1]